MKFSILLSFLFLTALILNAQENLTTKASSQIPLVYTNIVANTDGELFFVPITGGKKAPLSAGRCCASVPARYN